MRSLKINNRIRSRLTSVLRVLFAAILITTFVIEAVSANLNVREQSKLSKNRAKRQRPQTLALRNPILASAYVPESLSLARQGSPEGQRSQACPETCVCYRNREVRCSFRQLTTLPVGIPGDVDKLNLAYNKFVALPSRAFLAFAPTLKYLYLQSNEIRSLPGALAGLNRLENLRLSWNKLTSVRKNLFRDLTSIRRLYLDNNNITFLHPHALRGLTNLRLLQLEGNDISMLHPDTFLTMRFEKFFSFSHIQYLNLANNKFRVLPRSIFSGINNLRQVYLHGNPWECSCHLQWLHQWLRESGKYRCKKSVIRRGDSPSCAVCASPAGLEGQVVTQVSHDLITCSAPSLIGREGVSSTEVFREDPSLMEIQNEAAMFEFGSKPHPGFSLRLDGRTSSLVFMHCNASREPVAKVAVANYINTTYAGSFEVMMDCAVDYPLDEARLDRIIRPYLNSALNFTANRKRTRFHAPYIVEIQGEPLTLLARRGSGLRITSAALLSDFQVFNTSRSTVTIFGNRFRPEEGTLGLLFETTIGYQERSYSQLRDLPWVKALNPASSRMATYIAMEGRTVSLNCRAIGSPKPTLSWILPDGTVLHSSRRWGRFQVNRGGRLLIRGVSSSSDDGGIFRCLAQSLLEGSGIAEDIGSLRLFVVPRSRGGGSPNAEHVIVGEGSAWSADCSAQGIPRPVVAWANPSDKLLVAGESSGRVRVFENGTIYIGRVGRKHRGLYRCVAANRIGATLYSVYLNVTSTKSARRVVLGRRKLVTTSKFSTALTAITTPSLVTGAQSTTLTTSTLPAPTLSRVTTPTTISSTTTTTTISTTTLTPSVKTTTRNSYVSNSMPVQQIITSDTVGNVNLSLASRQQNKSVTERPEIELTTSDAATADQVVARSQHSKRSHSTDTEIIFRDRFQHQTSPAVEDALIGDDAISGGRNRDILAPPVIEDLDGPEIIPSGGTKKESPLIDVIDLGDELLPPPSYAPQHTQQLIRVNFGEPFQLTCPLNETTRISWTFHRRLGSGSRLNRAAFTEVISKEHPFPELAFNNSKVLSVARATTSHNGTFMCRSRRNDVHRADVIVVSSPPRFMEPGLSGITIDYGRSLSIPCSAQGIPPPEITWSWPMRDVMTATMKNLMMGMSRVYTEPDHILHIEEVTPLFGVTYLCTATNPFGRIVHPVLISVSSLAPKIDGEDQFLSRSLGFEVTMDCMAHAVPMPTRVWMLPNGDSLVSTNENSTKHQVLRNGSLYVTALNEEDAGSYGCIVTNAVGEASKQITLEVFTPTVTPTRDVSTTTSTMPSTTTTQTTVASQTTTKSVTRDDVISGMEGYVSDYRVKQYVVHDQTVFLNCRMHFPRHLNSHSLGTRRRLFRRASTATGRWTTPSGDVAAFPVPVPSWRHRVFSNGTLRIQSVNMADEGTYTCIATNKEKSQIRTSVNLVVRSQPPSLEQAMYNLVKVRRHRAASADCSATGHPEPRIRWTIPEGRSFSPGSFGTGLRVLSSGRLVLYNVDTDSAGTYVCSASSLAGNVTRVVDFKLYGFPPQISADRSTTEYVRVGSSIKLLCPADGVPEPQYRWKLPNGGSIKANEGEFQIGESRSKLAVLDSGTLAINRASKDDEGLYRCYATNRHGSDVRTVHLRVYY